ncbi:MAG: hypothetical protein GC193_03495 [Cryomorphaceae bacterium]|nr:hypothetical protein [Cryomorphaceae bacterium]
MCCPKTYKFLFIGLIAALTACSPSELANEMQVADLATERHEVSLSEFGFPVALAMSEDESGALMMDYNTADGRLLISCGTDCGFFLIEDPMSVSEWKEELMNQGLFNYQFYDEGTESVYYTSFLPDGTEYNRHYARVITVGSRHFIAVSDDDVVMSNYAVRNMAKIIDSIHGIE